jgi:putative membrane protein
MGYILPATDHARVAEAIRAAEANTSGEIFCILSRRRTAHPEIIWLAAAFLAFLLPMLAVWGGLRPWLLFQGWGETASVVQQAAAVVALQVATFFLAALLLWRLRAWEWLTPWRLRALRLHAIASEQFLAHGLQETQARTGVLIFASLAERHAEVVADEGIYARVSPELWVDAVAALLEEARAGDIAGGYVRAIGICGAVLAEHFPPCARNPNEISDRLIEI